MLATATKFRRPLLDHCPAGQAGRAAIETITENAWQPIPYWLSTPEVPGADNDQDPEKPADGQRTPARPSG